MKETNIMRGLSPGRVFFTSDTHFNHANIIDFCSRPYKTVKEMNEALINNWNSVVSKDDIIFHLGDVAWGGSAVWVPILKQLNGKKYLIVGNHDMKNLRSGYGPYFEEITMQKVIEIEGHNIYLNHYPFLCYGGSYRGANSVWQLFGHVHSGPKSSGLDIVRLQHLFPYQYDVGVDNNNYTPVSYLQIKEIINKRLNENHSNK